MAWVLFPLVLAALCLGLGLAVERASGLDLGVLLLPTGFAALVVLAQLPMLLEPMARFTTAIVAAAALAGLVLARPRRWPRLPVWPTVAAIATFLCYGAPILLSGEATFAGFIKLDDTATFLALVDRALEHGRSLDGLPPSTYETTLAVNLANGYPLGALLPLGVGGALVREDIAWLFQPYMAFAAALLALSLYAIARDVIVSPRVRAVCAVIAAQPALLFAYSLWGGIKEVVAAALLATASAALTLVAANTVRAFVPLATAAAALLGALSLGGGVWLVAPAVAVVVLGRRGGRRFALHAAGAAGLVLVLALPALVAASDFLRDANTQSFQQATELGNLVEPLAWQQVLGIWPSGDFRVEPSRGTITLLLLGLAAVAVVGAISTAVQRRRWLLASYVAAAALGVTILIAVGSPWVEAKALAIAAPALLLAALVGATLVAQWSRAASAVVLALLAFGVLWSNALAYHETNLAPRNRLAELERIGERFAGVQPALLTDYEVYGARHFLRDLAPESASELRRRFVYLRDGTSYLQKGASADIDAFQLKSVFDYDALVLRRGPAAGRPPSAYALAHEGRYYTVWVKNESALPILEHLALGDNDQAASVPRCDDVRRLASLPGVLGLLAPRAPRALALDLTRASAGPSLLFAADDVPAGRYDVFLGGSFRPSLDVDVGGSDLGTFRHELNWPGLFTPLGTVELGGGRVQAMLRPGSGDLRPGSGGPSESFGPLVIAEARGWRVETVVPGAWRSLCGKRWDWIEAVTTLSPARQG